MKRIFVLALALPAMLAAACGGDGATQPQTVNVPGSYDASSFLMTEGGVAHDLLAEGATVHLVLASGGTTAGTLLVPHGQENGGDLQEDLTGTWTLAGSTVTLTQSADTFLRDMQFQAQAGQLAGDATFGSVTVHLTLRKS